MSGNIHVFSGKASHYVKGRPGYPPEVIALLKSECGLTSGSIVADVASGTGIFTKLLLDNGNPVFAIEPNEDMRIAAEHYLKPYGKLSSMNRTAEATTLDDHSIDFVTVAHAVHWFNIPQARKEFLRILKNNGWLVIINNSPVVETPFELAYANLIKKYSINRGVKIKQSYSSQEAALKDLYGGSAYMQKRFPHRHKLDWEGLVTRILSKSDVPNETEPGHASMLKEIKIIFDKYQIEGYVAQGYKTKVRYGHIADLGAWAVRLRSVFSQALLQRPRGRAGRSG
jgi:ubiquinone/menaquinone biosynthesis C-methylase UbiE